MKKRFTWSVSILIIMLTVVCIIINFGGCADVNDTPKPTDPPVEEPTAVSTMVPTMVPTAVPTDLPTAVPTATPDQPEGAGETKPYPADQEIEGIGTLFELEVHVNSGNQLIAAYGIHLNFDHTIIGVDKSYLGSNNGVTPGADGFVAAVNEIEEGDLFVSGFDTSGKGPGADLHVFTAHFITIATGSTTIVITVKSLVDEATIKVGEPVGLPANVTVTSS